MLLNFLIRSQLTTEMGSNVTVVGVGIGGRVSIGASSGKDVFGLSKVLFLLHGVLSIAYSEGVGE